jgi:hypothetical protein
MSLDPQTSSAEALAFDGQLREGLACSSVRHHRAAICEDQLEIFLKEVSTIRAKRTSKKRIRNWLQGLESCRSVVEDYRAMLSAVQDASDGEGTEDDVESGESR